jgi:tetratricopeptide (TPR) repeat protein
MRYDPHRNCVGQRGGVRGACVAREGWRTLQQRVRRVSSAGIRLLVTNSLLVVALAVTTAAQGSLPETAAKPRGTASTASAATGHPAESFRAGQEALNHGQLDAAERDFRAVLTADPQSGAAYANLGVVYMRRKQWTRALEMLHHAERLLPQVPGIRLNIGLAYYRQNEFLKAIPAFESVVRDQPDAAQPRHLLGLCYFFVERWVDAANTLEPLWTQESGQLSYLYVLSIAAHRAGEKQLDEKATAQLVKAGENSPEFHLFMGKAHLNLEQYDMALADFQAAAEANPKLTFVHFNLGLTYLKKQDYERARDEFLKDVAVEPDLALNYDELGDVYVLMEQDTAAEKSYHEALRRDPKLVNSYFGLAKIYQRQGKYQQALSAIDAAGKLDPRRTDIHYVRGQVLIHMGRRDKGKKELETSVRIDNERRAEREKQVESGTVPSPELLQEDQ